MLTSMASSARNAADMVGCMIGLIGTRARLAIGTNAEQRVGQSVSAAISERNFRLELSSGI